MTRIVHGAACLVAAVFGSAAVAQQATDYGNIIINADVLPFIKVTVNTPAMTWTSTEPGSIQNNTGNLGTQAGVHRALFTVESNSNYNLVITNDTGCWTATNSVQSIWQNYQHVRFVSSAGNWLGSNIDLDRTPGTVGVTYEWNNINRNTTPPTYTTNCNIVSGTYPAETHQWALAAQFHPRITGNAANPNGIAGGLAPPGMYSTTAIITASTTP